MNRITVERVKAAYEKIGYKPTFRKWVNRVDKVCCPITAILFAENLYIEGGGYLQQASLAFGTEYVNAFLRTYDNQIGLITSDDLQHDGAIVRNFVLENYKHENIS